MKSTLKRVLNCIFFYPSATKGRVLLLLAITLSATFLEGFGVAMLYPIMDFVEKGKDFSVLASSSKMWLYIQIFFDALYVPKNLFSLICVVFALLILRQSFLYLKTTYSASMTQGLFHDIRSEGFKRFIRADLGFYDQYGVGKLINILTVDGARAGAGIFTFFNFIFACMVFLVYFVFLLILSWGMTFFAVSIIGCVGLVLRSRIARSERIGEEVSRHNEEMTSCIVQRLSGIRLLKLLATEEDEIRSVRGISNLIRSDTYDLSRIKARMEFIVDPMVIAAGLAILYLSVEVFRLSLAETGIFVFVLLRLMPYTKEIFHSRQELAGLSGSLLRVNAMTTEAKEACRIRGGVISEVEVARGIGFEDVSFAYDPGDNLVLKGVNLFIPAGKVTALIGRSGAGKSTLVDLIPRLRTPAHGKISLDDQAVENFNLRELRRAIAFVSQESFLFNDTIEMNIRYSRQKAAMAEVVEAAGMAYADGFIREFPEGYQTVVGDRGVRMSGGQRQRVALARALLQKARIIILDEPTSSLDSESELYIQKAIQDIRARERVTLIIIAHRLSTIRNADQIVVLEKGRVTECGSHSKLMHEDRWYADMVRMQVKR